MYLEFGVWLLFNYFDKCSLFNKWDEVLIGFGPCFLINKILQCPLSAV